jgi:phage protein U
MASESSFLNTAVPSAVLADPVQLAVQAVLPVPRPVTPLFVPLYAVSSISLSESYHLPPIGSSQERMMVAAHDDTISLSGLLVGPQRFTFKFMLETMADLSKRGTAIERITGGITSGLTLITSMTIRTDMQIQSLTFTASAPRRDVLDVSIALVHVPRPGVLAKVLDASRPLGVGALADFAG